jgi:hypothetical protein
MRSRFCVPAPATATGCRPGRVARFFCSAVEVVVTRGGVKLGGGVGAGAVTRGSTLLDDVGGVTGAAASGEMRAGAVRVGAASGAGSGLGA